MEDVTPVKKRLLELCNSMGVSANYFSKEIGRTREYISKISKEVGSEAMRNIHHRFPNVNILWIITGEGNMFLSEEDSLPLDTKLIVKLLEEERTVLKDERKANAQLREKVDLMQEEKDNLKDELSQMKIENTELRAQLDKAGFSFSSSKVG